MKTFWKRITKSFSRSSAKPAAAAVPPPLPPPTLAEARERLTGLDVDPRTVDQQIAFAQSLLIALGHDPATYESQVLAHQMAAEQLKMLQ
jgi:hypothetical protein